MSNSKLPMTRFAMIKDKNTVLSLGAYSYVVRPNEKSVFSGLANSTNNTIFLNIHALEWPHYEKNIVEYNILGIR